MKMKPKTKLLKMNLIFIKQIYYDYDSHLRVETYGKMLIF